MRERKLRTPEEIDAMVKKATEFVTEHPQNMFGEDNRPHYHLFMKLIEKFRKGESISQLERFVWDAYGENEVDEDDHENDEDHIFASDVIDWLQCYNDELY